MRNPNFLNKAAWIIISLLSVAVTDILAQESSDIYQVDFTSVSAVADWSNLPPTRFENDATVGNYMVVNGAEAGNAPKTALFSANAYVCVEFDMMLPSKKADGSTDNVIGGGNTGGIALMQGNTVAGIIGFRGSGSGTSDHILSKGGAGSDYFNVTADGKATAFKDMWLHYTVLVNTTSATGDFYVTNPADGAVYPQAGRYDQYLSGINALTHIGVVSDAGYAIAIANLKVSNPTATSLNITASNNLVEQYIPLEGHVSTVTYSADPQYVISYNKGGELTATSYVLPMAADAVAFSVLDNNSQVVPAGAGISVDAAGVLEITHMADAGDYTIKAQSGEVSAWLPLAVKQAGKADSIYVKGDEVISVGSKLAEYTYKGVPLVAGIELPEKPLTWTIVGDDLGCTMQQNVLSVPANCTGGILSIAVSIDGEAVSTSYQIHIRTSEMINQAKYAITGVIFKYGEVDVAASEGVVGVIVDKFDGAVAADEMLVVKAYDANHNVVASDEYALGMLNRGIQNVTFDSELAYASAAYVKAYVVDANGTIVSKEITPFSKGTYKGLPMASDWITNEKMGNGPGIMNPETVPAGVNPALVNTKNLNVTYRYNSDYKKIVTDNLLWYRTGGYDKNSTIYDRDGSDWEQQALPIGNGYLGGMLFGMPGKDHIQFNEETFWAAGYRGVQKSVSATTINPNMSEGINGFMNAGNIFVDFNLPNNPTITNYYRDLNLDEATAHVQYDYNNVTYKREYFASYPAEVMVFRYTADKEGALNFSVNPVSAHPGDILVKDGEITIIGNLKDSEPYKGGGNAAYSQKSDLEYCTKVKVIADDGELIDNYGSVGVKNATAVTVIVTAATDYDAEQFVIGADGKVTISDKQFKSLEGVQYAIDKAKARLANTEGKTYSTLKSEHVADYKAIFDRVAFSLTDKNEVCKTPTNELQASYNRVIGKINSGDKISFSQTAYNTLDQHLEELHYNYARYLMIAASRETTLPATLQGKWCQSVAEIWGSTYCININLEMNYWFAGNANLPESGLGFVKWLNSQIPAGQITAKNMYAITPKSYTLMGNSVKFAAANNTGADDVFIMHTKQSANGQTDMTGSTNIQSPGNTAWLIYNIWDFYQTSADKQLLADEIYPIMRKAANFYTQYLAKNRKTSSDKTTYPNGYYYTTGSGRSPEHGPTQEGQKYDLQLVAGMFDYTIKAAAILGVDTEKVAVWSELRDNLELPVVLGADGQIKEWKQEVKYNKTAGGNALGDPYHRHISHLVGLYPGTLVNRETPELLKGAKIVLDKRGDDATGWSIANKFLMWTRVLDGDKALQLFRYQLAQRTYANLFDFHAPFQIDGNFGSAAAVMELLMQSQTGTIYILPALPKVWDKGYISGIKAKTGAEVAIAWSHNRADEVKITPAVDGDIKLGYDNANLIKVTDGATSYYVDGVNGLFTIKNAKADVPLTITFVPLGVAQATKTDFRVYPNPTSGNLHIKCHNTSGCYLNVVDVYAKVIKTFGTVNHNHEFDLSLLAPSGLYMLNLMHKTAGLIDSRKVVLQ